MNEKLENLKQRQNAVFKTALLKEENFKIIEIYKTLVRDLNSVIKSDALKERNFNELKAQLIDS